MGDIISAIVIAISLVTLLIVAFGLGWVVGYQDGQVDAINGKIKYELVTQDNGEMWWRSIDEN